MPTKIDSIRLYKGRNLDHGARVEVYRNLRMKGRMYSVRQNGLVVGHTSRINLRNCCFVVNESGRQRVLKSRRKNVHAFVVGYPALITTDAELRRFGNQLPGKYNPYEAGHFMVYGVGQWAPIHASMRAELGPDGLTIWMPRA